MPDLAIQINLNRATARMVASSIANMTTKSYAQIASIEWQQKIFCGHATFSLGVDSIVVIG